MSSLARQCGWNFTLIKLAQIPYSGECWCALLVDTLNTSSTKYATVWLVNTIGLPTVYTKQPYHRWWRWGTLPIHVCTHTHNYFLSKPPHSLACSVPVMSSMLYMLIVHVLLSLWRLNFPFLLGFYSKDIIVEGVGRKYIYGGIYWLGLVSILFTGWYSICLLFLAGGGARE